jgi:hypothetical protein
VYPGYAGPVVVRGFVDLLSASDDDNDEMYFSTALVNGDTGACVLPRSDVWSVQCFFSLGWAAGRAMLGHCRGVAWHLVVLCGQSGVT